MAWLDRAVEERFISPPHRRLVQVDVDLEALLARFDRWIAPSDRWGGPPVE